MALTYLLDTNILSELIKPQPQRVVIEKFSASQGELALASVTWHELLFGLYCLPVSDRRDIIESFLFERIAPLMPILPYDHRAAQWLAQERARLSQIGQPPSLADGQIAAIAATNNLTLVTRNTKDFVHFSGLEVDDWFRV